MNQRDVVINALGQARLEPYLLEVGGNKKRALNLYRWSVQLSSSIQETLGLTEVLLRNAIDEQLQKWNNKQLGKTTSWLLEPPATPLRSLVSRKREEALRRAHSSARLRTAGHPRYSAQTTHDDVLAHTMFGMWKDILPNHTPQSNLNSQKTVTVHNFGRKLYVKRLCTVKILMEEKLFGESTIYMDFVIVYRTWIVY